MPAFHFRGATIRVTHDNLVIAQDLTRLVMGRHGRLALRNIPYGEITSRPLNTLTGDVLGLRPTVRLLHRNGVVRLLDSIRYPLADELLAELDKVLEPDPRTPIQIQPPDLRSRIQSANTIEDLRSVLLDLYLEIQGP